jgi:hypothetical protein
MLQDAASGLNDAITAPRYRTVEEEKIIAFLISPYAVAAGERQVDLPVAAALLERCISLGMPFRTGSRGERLFDPVEVANGIKNLYFTRGEPIWMDRSVGMLRRLMSEAAPGATPGAPPKLELLSEAKYEITIRRQFSLKHRRASERLHLRLPLPLDYSDVQFLPPSGLHMEPRIFPGRLEVRLTAPEATSEIALGVRIRFTAEPSALNKEPAPDGPARELWTRHREGLIKVDERISTLANRLAAGSRDPWTVMRRLWDHLFDSFQLGFIHYDLINPADPLGETLRSRRFDCRTGSALLAALCRALGFPARLASGYTLNPVLPTAHSWCEVWLPDSSWAAFDLYSFDLAGGDRTSPWRQHFFGQLDHRFVCERLPLVFCGAGSIRLPSEWQSVMRRRDDGAETRYEVLETGDLVYAETVDVIREA